MTRAMDETEPLTSESRSEFRIRFTRARGFAALFEYPANSYRWSGRGTLCIEPRGVHFLAKRRRLGFPRIENRFFAGPQIRDVYRQAESIRVEFRDNLRHAFLNFWAEDSVAAASIVGLLPPTRTVESENVTDTRSRPQKVTAKIRVVVGVTLVLLVVSAWLGVALIQRDGSRRLAAGSKLATSSVASVAESAKAVTAEEMRVLKADFGQFSDSSDVLAAQFRTALFALQDGSLSQEDFSEGLERWLIPQWKSQERKLQQASFATGSQRARLRALLIEVTTSWQHALSTYVSGLRAQDYRIVRSAFALIGQAERSEQEAYKLVIAPPQQG